MKIFVLALFLILIVLLVSVFASEDNSWKEKLGSDLKKKFEERRLFVSWFEKEKVIIFTDDKESIKKFGEIDDKVTIIPAVSAELSLASIEAIAKLPTTKKILINHKVEAFRIESIPLIKANLASSSFLVNGTGINISIVDTGIFNHTEFQAPNRIIKQKCYCVGQPGPIGCCPNGLNEDINATDDDGHGTHVAGIAAGKGDGYGKGVATNASLFAVKVLDSNGSGYDWDVVKGINWAVENKANVISLSLGVPYDPSGQFGYQNCYDVASSLAVDNATRQGAIVIVAAGNCGPGGSSSCPTKGDKAIAAPGCAKTAITVGASDDNDNIASFSSRGPTHDNRTKPDLTAPGVTITSTYLGNGWYTASGTSQATPHVTGVAALLLEKYNKTFGYFPEPGRVKAILLTAVNITKMQQNGYNQRNNVYGSGRIDAYEAIRIMNFTKNDTISQGEQKFYIINTTNNSIKVTLVWMENSSVNNNLDLIVGNDTHNFTYPTDANDTIEQIFLYNISPGIWKVYVNGTKVIGQQEFFLASDSRITSDIIPPKWSNVSFNQLAERGEEITISVYWSDESGLSHAILSTNETGCGLYPCYNRTILSLSGSQVWSNFSWINSSLSNGTVIVWKVYANDTFGNQNATQEFNFTIVDTKAPLYFNLTNTTDSAYAKGKLYQFNITIFDYSGIDDVVFEWNKTKNYTYRSGEILRDGNLTLATYYINLTDLSAGNYSYRWFTNDTLSNWNFTSELLYNITKIQPQILLIILPSNETFYSETPILANGSVILGDVGANISLYRNGSLVNSSISFYILENITLPTGTWNYTLTYNETQNYTFFAITNITKIIPAPTSIVLLLNDTQGNVTYDKGAIINITAQINVSSLNVTIATNFTGIYLDIINSIHTANNLTNTSNLDLGVYNITAYYNGYNLNYSSSSKTYFLILREAYRNYSVNVTNNTLTLIDARKLNITLKILTNDTVTDSLNITVGKDNPVSVNPKAISIGKYISIEAGNKLKSNLTYVIINVSYLDLEVPPNVDENSLRLYRWNSSDWIRLEQNDGVNVINNYVWANLTSFSDFTIAGLLANNQNCNFNSDCSSNICCHNVCRQVCPYCGDGYCDPSETYSSCLSDCKAPTSSFTITEYQIPNYVYDFLAIIPEEIKMFSNESKQFELIVKNLANGNLTNLQIKVKTEPYCCDIEITPKKLDLLKPTNSTSFLIVISSGIKPGNYTLIFNISSDQIWKEISTRLMVKELIKEATLIDEFSNLLKKINYLYNSALNKEKEGYDVKEVIETLKNAKIACDEKDYERCLNLINKADELLKNVKKPLPIVIIFFIIIMLLALIFIKIKFNFGKIRKILLIL